jgi:hypothetical protein
MSAVATTFAANLDSSFVTGSHNVKGAPNQVLCFGARTL